MPYFDYLCDKCEEPFEIYRGISADRSDVTCPKCGNADVRRNFSSVYLPKKAGGGMSSGGSGGGKCGSCSSGNCASCG